MSLIALDETPGPITVVGDAVWVVADADWQEHGGDDAARSAVEHEPARRPIIWAAPVILELPSWVRPVRPDDDIDVDLDLDLDLDLDVDDEDDIDDEVARPVWRIQAGVADRIDLGGDVLELVALAGEDFLVILRRPKDPLVKTPHGRGSVGYSYPGVVARCDRGGEVVVLAHLPSTNGALFVDGSRSWLAGFGLEPRPSAVEASTIFGSGPVALHELDVETGRLTASVVAIDPDAVVDNIGVVVRSDFASRFGGRTTKSEALCFDLGRPETPPLRIELPHLVETSGDVVVSEGQTWFMSRSDQGALVWLDARDGTTSVLTIVCDLAENAPAPVPPTGVDLDQFEQQELEGMRASLLGGWRDQSGKTQPFLEGVEFERIELRGRFPDTQVVSTFRAADRPGILFARRWNLYDELGNTSNLEYADIHLMEDVKAVGRGFPPLDECEPDVDGVVWF
ncbi:MAG: hypothetical protein WD271_09920 [Acidimicrobiia bacterium]